MIRSLSTGVTPANGWYTSGTWIAQSSSIECSNWTSGASNDIAHRFNGALSISYCSAVLPAVCCN
jgi:hypothetical protein